MEEEAPNSRVVLDEEALLFPPCLCRNLRLPIWAEELGKVECKDLQKDPFKDWDFSVLALFKCFIPNS